MELREILTTNASYRSFTKEAMGDEVVYEILDLARFAPSGGNRQSWKVILLKDPQIRLELRRLYQLSWREYVAHLREGLVPFAPIEGRSWNRPAVDLEAARETPAPSEFGDNLENVPALLVVCAKLDRLAVMDNGLQRQSIVGGGSIYPFAYNILLAARSKGYGGVLTTALCRQEPAVMDLLGIESGYGLAALVALGKPVKVLSRLTRGSVEEFTTVDMFHGEALVQPRPTP